MTYRNRSLLAVLAALAALMLAVAGCGDDDGDGGGETSAVELLRTAASKEIDSAEVRMRAATDIPGFPVLSSRLAIAGAGGIASNGPDELPTADLQVTLRAAGQSFPARLTAVDGSAYVEFQGTAYEVDPEMLDRIPFGHGKAGAGDKAMSLRSMGIDPSQWLTDAKVQDGEEIGGDSTQLVTGTVDVPAVLADVIEAADSPDVQEKIEKAGGSDAVPELSGKNLDKLEQAVERLDVEVNVDDEGYPRRVFARLDFKVPDDVRKEERVAFEGGTVTFDLVLEEIGVDVDVTAPTDVSPLSDLFGFAGLIFGIEEPADIWRAP